MRKQEQRFNVTVKLEYGNIIIGGVGYFYPEDTFDKIDYDIDEATFEGNNILPVLKSLLGDLQENDDIHYPIMNHLNGLFYGGPELRSLSLFKAKAS